jgi:hypothetical protein
MFGITQWIDPTKNKKLEELIIYISEKSKNDPSFGATKLNKILFFADFVHYGSHGKAITNAEYVHRSNGPTPKFMKPALDSLEKESRIKIDEVSYFGYQQKRVVPLTGPDLSMFGQTEISFVDEVIEVFKAFNGSELSTWTHLLIPWLLTEEEETIPYETIFVLNNKPIDKAGLRWAQKELEELAKN